MISPIFAPQLKQPMQNSATWFKVWFDSPYYHLLYKHRDRSEAARFISQLMQSLNLPKGSRILDMGCGKGRHSILLNELGYDVVGIDLSVSNIESANKTSKADLKFLQHDMRQPIEGAEFDLVINLFTSFGYFDSAEDNLKVLQSAHSMLTDNGQFVLDFMNAPKTIKELVTDESRKVEDTVFHIHRKVEHGVIIKEIKVDNDPELIFEERVQALTREELIDLFDHAGFILQATYGSYSLHPFNPETSDRLIIIANKKK